MIAQPIEAARRIEDLEFEVRSLKAELGRAADGERVAKWRQAFGFTQMQAALFDIFVNRGDHPSAKGALLDALYDDHDDPPEPKVLDVMVCQMRKKLPPGAISTVWGLGYVLTGAGREAAGKVMGWNIAVHDKPNARTGAPALSLWRGVWSPVLPRPMMSEIIADVAHRGGVKVADIKGASTARRVAEPRQEFYSLALREGFASTQIGAFCGRRDHSTVLSGAAQHAKRVSAQ